MKTYPIFLASSFELKPERERFEIFIGRQNKRLAKKNVMMELEVWEDMGAELNDSRKQDDYNKILDKAEFVVVLFWTRMGKYTREEFELAYQRFLDSGNRRPLVYVYEKTAPDSGKPEESKKEFIKRLQTEGKEQFHCTFDHYSAFESHFQQTLSDLFEKNELTFGRMAERHSLKAPFPPTLIIGRDRELETVSEKFKNKGQIVLISAEGGMGKTTLASKYWQENRYTYTHCAYLFCEGGILRAMIEDGIGLDLQGLDDSDKIRQLQRKLSGLADDFLLFLDNANRAEDIGEFFNAFPGYNWNVLITSRCREVLVNKTDEISLSHLDPEDAKTLFRTFYSEDSDEFEVLLDKLLKGISYHTLLTEVLAKNLREASEMGTDLKSFLKKLEEKGLVLDRDDNFEINTIYDKSVLKQASTVNDILEILYDFSKLSEKERFLLVNLALLPLDSYSLQFLLNLFIPEDRRAFRDNLKTLFRRGWVGGGDQLYRLSPVIQQMVLHRNHESKWEDGKDYLQKLTDLMKPENDKDNAHTKFKWIPFGRYLANIFQNYEESILSSCLNHLGILLRTIGGQEKLFEAMEYHKKALTSDLKNSGENSPAVAKGRSNLATVLRELGGEGNLLEAKSHLEKALASDIKNFGEDFSFVAIRRSNLALVLGDLGGVGNLLEAKKHLLKALASDILNFGEDSHPVARQRSILGLVLSDLGDKENLLEAKGLFEKALASDILNFGEVSPVVAIRRHNLAWALRSIGGDWNIREAKAQLETALSLDIQNFGEDTPTAASTMFNLGVTIADIGNKESLMEALKYLKAAKEVYLKHFDKDYHLVQNIQSWINSVDKKLDKIRDQ